MCYGFSMYKYWYKSVINKYKKEYRKERSVHRPAFHDEKVYFDERGFNHLLMKGGKYRPISDQIRRLKLMKFVHEIVKESDDFNKYYFSARQDSVAYFWSLSKIVGNQLIIVIIRQIGVSGNKHFLSVMNKRLS